MGLQISRLAVFPLKSAAGMAVTSAEVTAQGLAWDRRWMLVDAQGLFLSQRRLPRMALIQAGVEQGALRVSAPGMEDLLAVPETPEPVTVQVWDDRVLAETVSDRADAWFTRFLGQAARLVYFPDQAKRKVDPDWAGEGHFTAFSDGFPFLVATQASFDRLSSVWGRPVVWQRFRPNIVIAGTELPFMEDEWSKLRINGMEFALVKPCSRCVIPSIDPTTAEKDRGLQEVLLKLCRRDDGKIYLGQNAVLTAPGPLDRIQVGDPVVISSR